MVYDDYAGVIWALRQGNAHMAWLGNKGAIEAVDRANAEVGVQIINKDGQNGYYSHLIARKDSGLKNLDAVLSKAEDLTFGMGDPNSTSGSLVPGYYIFAKREIDPTTAFKRMTQAGHEDNFHAVFVKKVDVATSNSSDLQRFAKRFPEEYEAIKVIWTSPLIPSDPIVWMQSLPDAIKEKTAAFFASYGQKEGATAARVAKEQKVLEGLNWSGFRRSDDSQLVPVRILKLYKELLETRNDPALSEEKKLQRVENLELKINSLQ